MNPNFFRFHFWFDRFPTPFIGMMDTFFLINFGGAIIIAIILMIVRKFYHGMFSRTKELFSSITSILIWFGLIGGFIYFSRHENAIYLGMRIWFGILYFITLINLVRAILKFKGISIKKLFKKSDTTTLNHKVDQYNKYLPEHNPKHRN